MLICQRDIVQRGWRCETEQEWQWWEESIEALNGVRRGLVLQA